MTKTKTTDSIREVDEFLEIEARIVRLRDAHPQVFEQFDALADEYNTSLKAVEKRLRPDGISAGPFQVTSTTTTYDADRLYEELDNDEDAFLALGGKIEKKVVYSLDKQVFEARVNANKVSKAVLDAVRAFTYRYKKPHALTVR